MASPGDRADSHESVDAASPFAHAVIAVDGGAGAGKSSTSRAVARRLGMRYLDTGAMYRAATLAVLRAGAPLDDDEAVIRVVSAARLVSGTEPDASTITLDGADVSREIRTAAVTSAVSRVSAIPAVRRRMVEVQHAEIADGGIVVEGRDIGTVVAPDADLKIFLVADAPARAERRAAQLGHDPTATVQVQADLARRDGLDSSRAVSPLVCAPDAVVVDSTSMALDDVVDHVVRLAEGRLAVRHVG